MNTKPRRPANRLGRVGLVSALAAIACLAVTSSALANILVTSRYSSTHKGPGQITVYADAHELVNLDISDVGQTVQIEDQFGSILKQRGTCLHDTDLSRNYVTCEISPNISRNSRRLSINHMGYAQSVAINARGESAYFLRINGLSPAADVVYDGYGNDLIKTGGAGDQISAAFGADEVRASAGVVDVRDGEPITADTADEVSKCSHGTVYADYNDVITNSLAYPAVPGGPVGHCDHVYRDDPPL